MWADAKRRPQDQKGVRLVCPEAPLNKVEPTPRIWCYLHGVRAPTVSCVRLHSWEHRNLKPKLKKLSPNL